MVSDLNIFYVTDLGNSQSVILFTYFTLRIYLQ